MIGNHPVAFLGWTKATTVTAAMSTAWAKNQSSPQVCLFQEALQAFFRT